MGKNRDLEEYERETRTFEEELVSGPFFLKWIFLAWICFEPFLAITWAGHFWLGDTLYFSLYLIFWALPGAFLAVIFGAMRIAQIIISRAQYHLGNSLPALAISHGSLDLLDFRLGFCSRVLLRHSDF